MRSALCLTCALLLSRGASAQAQSSTRAIQNPSALAGATQNSGSQDALAAEAKAVQQEVVPISAEPHHRLILQNDYAHVYSVSVPPLDATRLHRHDLPYLAVSLVATNIANDVTGKAEVHMVLEDGQVTYSAGGFSHVVRTDAGTAFSNITVELAKPQGTARNLCKHIVVGPLGECPQQTVATGKKAASETSDDIIPYFETEEVRVEVVQVTGGHDYVDASPKLNALLVAMSNANLDANLGGEHASFLHDGDILWMPAGVHRRVMDFLGTRSTFLLIWFKDSAAAKP
jgi:hypothetical protein